jgi:hypothetical protein
MVTSYPTTPFDLMELIAEFYTPPELLGQCTLLPASELPAPYGSLLAHNHHMTVTVERFHRSPVDVQVLQHHQRGAWYSREILLITQTTRRIVQYGIVRIRMDHLSPQIRSEIESQRQPLGRVLIDHGVMREVKLGGLYRVVPSNILARCLGLVVESHVHAAPIPSSVPSTGVTRDTANVQPWASDAAASTLPSANFVYLPQWTCYGRSAQIHVDGESAIDLFELMPPELPSVI